MWSFLTQFVTVMKNYKKNPAVAYWNERNSYTTLSYEEVDEISKNIIVVIRNTIKEKHVCIGLYMDHNHLIPSLIISLQKCDLAFIFLDPYVPATNLSFIEKLKLKWLISINHEHSNTFLSKYAREQADLEKSNSLKLWKFTSTETDNLFKEICFVVCTSGTTGEPKVVQVQQECIMSNIKSLRKKFEITQTDVIYFGTPLTFDPSIVELFLALTSGATLLIVSSKIKINSTRLLTLLFPKESIYKGVTFLQIVPSLFLRWNKVDIEFILQSTACRILAFGGEKFPESILKIKKSGSLRIFNLYGITEVSCWASVHEVKNNDEEISLGDPLEDTILEVRDDSGSRISDGEGELYIGSFSRICYINHENKSTVIKPVFRSTGDTVRIKNKGLFYVCRKNNIIKRLGHRLNLSEIEEIVSKETDIPNTCIWLENKRKLVLFIVVPEFNPVTKLKIVDKLRVKLLHALPKQCFPDHIEIIPNFVLTKHGKIDKKSLENVYNNLVSSSNSIKIPVEVFTFLWSKYLGLCLEETEKYQQCNFFEVGGNSVSAIQFLSEFQEIIRADYPSDLTTLLFENTLQECCNFLNDSRVVPLKKRQHSSEASSSNKIRILEEVNVKKGENNIKLRISWQHDLKACVDSSPTIIESRNTTVIAVGSFSHIFAALDSTNGTIISQIVLPDTIEGGCCASPLKEHIYTGCYDGKMYCIDYTSSRIIWEYSTGDRIKCTPCLCLKNQAIAFGSYDKSIHCVDIENGTLLWKTLVSESVPSNPICYEQKIYVATTFGTCLCLSENNGEILWKYKVGVPIFGSPCVDNLNGNIIWPDVSGNLHSFSCKNGKKCWTFKAIGNIYSSLTRYTNFVIFGCHDHNIYCVQINENVCISNYKVQLDSAITSTPQILEYQENTYIIAATNLGNIYVIEFGTGKIIESLHLQGEVFSSPAIKNNQIYIGCRDNNLYCLSIVNK